MLDIKKRLPVGIEEFAEIRADDYYYVDKTDMIRELLMRRGKVNLFTRPRRFGKSLNMSMLKHFLKLDAMGNCLMTWQYQTKKKCCKNIWADFLSYP